MKEVADERKRFTEWSNIWQTWKAKEGNSYNNVPTAGRNENNALLTYSLPQLVAF